MGALQIADLTDEEKLLVGRYTYRVFAEMRRFVEQGGVLHVEVVQEFENAIMREITAQWTSKVEEQTLQAEGAKQ